MSVQRVAVVTGASSGIGQITATALAAQGWRVIGLGRDPGRSAAAEAAIRAAARGGGTIAMVRADLSLMADAARAAREIAALTDRIDVLVDNAGGTSLARVVTPEGNEESFAANHLGPFLLTRALLPLLRAAAAASPPGQVRIVVTSSSAAERLDAIDWDDPQLLHGDFDSGRAYCIAKLANLLFSRGLAARLAKDGIVVHAIHPGPVDTNFFTRSAPGMRDYVRKEMGLLTPEQGADTMIWLATAEAPGRSTGGYFFERAPRALPPPAEDDAVVDRFWTLSERLVDRTE